MKEQGTGMVYHAAGITSFMLLDCGSLLQTKPLLSGQCCKFFE